MNKKGFFVTFEGGEGCGKSTQTQLFSQFLKQQNISYFSSREPGGTNFAEYIRMLVKDPTFDDKSELSEILLFEAARSDVMDKIVKPTLASGGVMVLDRFYDSTLAYQGYGSGMDKDTINYLNKIASDGIEPDLTFYLKISPEIAFERKKGDKLDNFELKGLEFHKRVEQGFDEIAKENKHRYVIIDATKDKNEIQKEIKEIFLERYNA